MNVLNRTAVAAATALISLASTAAMANGWGHGHHHWYPWFGHNVDRLPTFLAEVPDATGHDSFSAGNLWVGSGIPATNMILRENPFAKVELSIKGMYRTGDDILPDLVDGDGTIHVQVPSGHQVIDPAHNVSAERTDRAALEFHVLVQRGYQRQHSRSRRL